MFIKLIGSEKQIEVTFKVKFIFKKEKNCFIINSLHCYLLVSLTLKHRKRHTQRHKDTQADTQTRLRERGNVATICVEDC